MVSSLYLAHAATVLMVAQSSQGGSQQSTMFTSHDAVEVLHSARDHLHQASVENASASSMMRRVGVEGRLQNSLQGHEPRPDQASESEMEKKLHAVRRHNQDDFRNDLKMIMRQPDGASPGLGQDSRHNDANLKAEDAQDEEEDAKESEQDAKHDSMIENQVQARGKDIVPDEPGPDKLDSSASHKHEDHGLDPDEQADTNEKKKESGDPESTLADDDARKKPPDYEEGKEDKGADDPEAPFNSDEYKNAMSDYDHAMRTRSEPGNEDSDHEDENPDHEEDTDNPMAPGMIQKD